LLQNALTPDAEAKDGIDPGIDHQIREKILSIVDPENWTTS
jgi:hypothetical protein